MTVLSTLLKRIKQRVADGAGQRSGICALLASEIVDASIPFADRLAIEVELYQHMATWAERSESHTFPIPYSRDNKSRAMASTAFWDDAYAGTCWTGERSQLRMELLDHCICESEKQSCSS